MKDNALDTYLDLCTQVYDLSKPKPPQDAYALYRDYVANCKGSVLEPMCGTGRFLLPLLEEGFDVQGFDASPHMLKALHEKAELKKLAPKVWQGFLEGLDSKDKYALIFISSGSFNLITDIEQAKICLKKIYHQLEDDGIFVFEGITPNWQPSQFEIWRGSVWHRKDGKFIMASFLDSPDQDNIRTSICKYELVDENTLIKTEIEKMQIRLYESHDLISMLKEVGFKQVVLRKTFDKTQSPEPNDEEIIYECRK